MLAHYHTEITATIMSGETTPDYARPLLPSLARFVGRDAHDVVLAVLVNVANRYASIRVGHVTDEDISRLVRDAVHERHGGSLVVPVTIIDRDGMALQGGLRISVETRPTMHADSFFVTTASVNL